MTPIVVLSHHNILRGLDHHAEFISYSLLCICLSQFVFADSEISTSLRVMFQEMGNLADPDLSVQNLVLPPLARHEAVP